MYPKLVRLRNLIDKYNILGQRECACLPGRRVQVQPARLQIVAVPFVRGITEQVGEPPFAAAEVRERQPDVALALISRVVDRHQQSFAAGTFPAEG